MKILVTGGAGFIGSHLVESLLEEKNSIINIDNFDDYYNPEFKKSNISSLKNEKDYRFYEFSILDKKKLNDVFSKNKIDKVVHLAAKVGVRPSLIDPVSYIDVNVKGTLNILEACKKFNVKKMVFISSSSIYGDNKKLPFSENDKTENQISAYAASKKAGEILCYSYFKNFGISINCLRLFTVYGPRGRPDMAPYKFTENILNNRRIEIFGDGSSRRDYTFVADIVGGIKVAIKNDFGFEIFNLGKSNPVKLKDLISEICTITGKKADIVKKEIPMGDMEVTYADISKSKKMLNYDPKTSISKGLKDFIMWFKDERM